MSWQKLKDLIQTMDEQREGSQSGKAFEELVARLLESHLKIPFVVAKSGTQPSGDARSMDGQVAIQVKIRHPKEIKRNYVDDGVLFLRAQNVRPLSIDLTSNPVYIIEQDEQTAINWLESISQAP